MIWDIFQQALDQQLRKTPKYRLVKHAAVALLTQTADMLAIVAENYLVMPIIGLFFTRFFWVKTNFFRDKHLKFTPCVDNGQRRFPCPHCLRHILINLYIFFHYSDHSKSATVYVFTYFMFMSVVDHMFASYAAKLFLSQAV